MLALPMALPVGHLPPQLGCAISGSTTVYGPHGDVLTPVPSKRPKLSLQTSQSSMTSGRSSSSTSITNIHQTTSNATPTSLNTFSNTHGLTFRPSPSSAIASPGSHRLFGPFSCSQSPQRSRLAARSYPITSPFGLKPILKNSAFHSDWMRNAACTSHVSPWNARRIFFPTPKKVSFQGELEEVIVTRIYTASHFDLVGQKFQDEASDIEPDDASQYDSDAKNGFLALQTRKRKSTTLYVRSEETMEGAVVLDEAELPRRSRKRRRWEWTLPKSGPDSPFSAHLDEEEDHTEQKVEAYKSTHHEAHQNSSNYDPSHQIECAGDDQDQGWRDVSELEKQRSWDKKVPISDPP